MSCARGLLLLLLFVSSLSCCSGCAPRYLPLRQPPTRPIAPTRRIRYRISGPELLGAAAVLTPTFLEQMGKAWTRVLVALLSPMVAGAQCTQSALTIEPTAFTFSGCYHESAYAGLYETKVWTIEGRDVAEFGTKAILADLVSNQQYFQSRCCMLDINGGNVLRHRRYPVGNLRQGYCCSSKPSLLVRLFLPPSFTYTTGRLQYRSGACCPYQPRGDHSHPPLEICCRREQSQNLIFHPHRLSCNLQQH